MQVRLVDSNFTGARVRKLYCESCERESALERARRRFEERCHTIPPAFRWARLGAPELDERVGRHARDVVAARLGDMLDRGGETRGARCVFLGGAGSGKTSLAVACFREAMLSESAGLGLFTHAWRLGLSRAKYPLGQGDPPEFTAATSADLLVLDDVGTEPGSAPNPVAECIFERHAAGLPTWVTTGLTDAQIAARYGDGIARRIFEGAIVLDCGAA
jgi:DNA replication protein DnaC